MPFPNIASGISGARERLAQGHSLRLERNVVHVCPVGKRMISDIDRVLVAQSNASLLHASDTDYESMANSIDLSVFKKG